MMLCIKRYGSKIRPHDTWGLISIHIACKDIYLEIVRKYCNFVPELLERLFLKLFCWNYNIYIPKLNLIPLKHGLNVELAQTSEGYICTHGLLILACYTFVSLKVSCLMFCTKSWNNVIYNVGKSAIKSWYCHTERTFIVYQVESLESSTWPHLAPLRSYSIGPSWLILTYPISTPTHSASLDSYSISLSWLILT